MEVLEVKRAKKHLCQIELWSGEKLYIDIETATLEGIKPGVDLSETDIETLKYKSDFTRAKSKALYFLGLREYSKKELFRKLKPDFAPEPLEEAIELLSEAGVIDDARFAESYSYDLAKLKKMSKNGVKSELIRKGIDRELAEEFAENAVEDESEQIKEIILLKYKNWDTDEKIKRRMFAGLARKGYSFDTIKHVLNEFKENY